MKEKIKDIAVMSYLLSLLLLPLLCVVLHKQSMKIEEQRIELYHTHNRENIYKSRNLFKRDLIEYYDRRDSVIAILISNHPELGEELETLGLVQIEEAMFDFIEQEDKHNSLIYTPKNKVK